MASYCLSSVTTRPHACIFSILTKIFFLKKSTAHGTHGHDVVVAAKQPFIFG